MAITYNNLIDFQQVYTASDGGTTFSSNLYNSTNFDLFSDSAEVGDCIYFGFKSPRLHFKGINFYIDTAFAATSKTLVWEYAISRTSWATLPDLVDDTNGFTATGENEVSWGLITTKAAYQIVNGQYCDWIRVRISAIDTPTEGGHQSTQVVQARDGAITISDPGNTVSNFCQECYDEDVSNGWGVVETVGNRSFYFKCHIFLGFPTDSDVTRVIDKSKFIEIIGLIWGRKLYSEIELGEYIDETKKTSKNGCCIVGDRILSSYFSNSYSIRAKFYNGFSKFSFYSLNTCYNSVLESTSFAGYNDDHGTIYSNLLVGTTLDVGTNSLREGTKVIRPVVYNKVGSKAIRLTYSSYMFNPIILDATYLGYCDNNSKESDSVIINPETETFLFNWATNIVDRGPKVGINYTFKLKVTNNNEDNIEGVVVKLVDKNGNNALFIENGRITSNMTKGNTSNFRPSVNEYSIGDYVKVGCEVVKITGGSYNIFTVDRGQLGTDDIYQYQRQIFKLHNYLETDSNGDIEECVVETNNYKKDYGTSTPGVTYENDYNPYTLTITKDGYEPYIWKGNIDSAVDWTIKLSPLRLQLDQESI